jgi:hypothetical protein
MNLSGESSAYLKKPCDQGLEILEEKADLILHENQRIGCTSRDFKMQVNYSFLVYRCLVIIITTGQPAIRI